MLNRGILWALLRGMMIYLFMRPVSLLLSLPAWLLLTLYFTSGVSLRWFGAYSVLWLTFMSTRYLYLVFAHTREDRIVARFMDDERYNFEE